MTPNAAIVTGPIEIDGCSAYGIKRLDQEFAEPPGRVNMSPRTSTFCLLALFDVREPSTHERGYAVVVENVVRDLPGFSETNQAKLTQRAKRMGHSRLRQREQGGEVAHAQFFAS